MFLQSLLVSLPGWFTTFLELITLERKYTDRRNFVKFESIKCQLGSSNIKGENFTA